MLCLGDWNPLCRGSPLSQKLALRAVREGSRRDLGACLQTEFRLAVHVLRQPSDFCTGVTALLIDKSGTPAWQPASLQEVLPAPAGPAGPVVLLRAVCSSPVSCKRWTQEDGCTRLSHSVLGAGAPPVLEAVSLVACHVYVAEAPSLWPEAMLSACSTAVRR